MILQTLTAKLQADTGGFTRPLRDAEGNLSKFAKTAGIAGAAVAAAFGVAAIKRFGTESVRTFGEAEAIWTRLGSAVDATGVSFEGMRGEIERAAASMQAATTIGDEDYAAALQRLVLQTGSVTDSMGQMGLVADLAAANQTSAADAADLLARAMAGNTTQLTRLFPSLLKSTDLFGDLQKIIGGTAENEAKTFQGRMTQLNNAWGDFQEAIGAAIVGASDGADAMSLLTAGVQKATRWIEEHGAALSRIGAGMVKFGEVAIRVGGLVVSAFGEILRELSVIYGWVVRLNSAIDRIFGRNPQSDWVADVGVQARESESAVTSLGNRIKVDLTQKLKSAKDNATELRKQLESMDDAIRRGLTIGLNSRPLMVGAIEVDPAAAKRFAESFRQRAILTAALDLEIKEGGRPPRVDPVREATGILAGAKKGIADVIETFRTKLTPAVMVAGAGFALLAPVFQGFKTAVGPAVQALAMPLQMVGQILGTLVVPALRLLFPALKAVALVSAMLGETFANVAGWFLDIIAGLKEGLGHFMLGLGKILGPLGGPLRKYGRHLLEGAEDIKRAAAEFRGIAREMEDQQKTIRELSFEDAMKDATDAVSTFADAVSNMPAIFDLTLRRRQAAQSTVTSAPAIPQGGPTDTGGTHAGTTVVVNNPPARMDIEEFKRQVARAITELGQQGGVSPLDLAYRRL